jgi:outer membrane protein assembly factor BamB
MWTRGVDGELLAAPVVEGGAVYASTVGGWTYKFDEKTGKRAWAKPLYATSAPWVDGDKLYVTRRDAKGAKEAVSVVDAATGKIIATRAGVTAKYLWDVPMSTENSEQVFDFEGSRPVVEDGVEYDAMGGIVRASDPATGDVLWTRRYAAGEGKRSTGAVAVAGPEVVVSTRGGEVYGLDVDTGYTLWAYGINRAVVAQPIVAKGWVYATTTDGEIVAMNVGDTTLDGWHMWGGNAQHDGAAK